MIPLARAVGPALKAFGLAHPAAKPRFRYFDAKGNGIHFVHPAIALDWPAMFAAAGAFPLTESGDAFDYESFASGTDTIQVSDDSAQGGTVFLEIHELTGIIVCGGPGRPVTPPGTVKPGG